MRYILAFGYYGTQIDKMSGTIISKLKTEPTLSIDKIVKFFKLEKDKAGINLDLDLVYQGSNESEQQEIKIIWREVIAKKLFWKELKYNFIRLLVLGENLLPLIFYLNFDRLSIIVYNGGSTISIIYEDFKKLEEFKRLIEKEHKERISPGNPFHRPGGSKKLEISELKEKL